MLEPLLEAWRALARRERRARPRCAPRRWSRTASAPASPASSKASSASRTRPTSSPPCAPAGRRCGPRRALRYMATHDLDPGRHRDGGADPAAGRRARVRRRIEPDRRRRDADQRDLGARLRDRAGRGRARSHRARRAQGFLRTIDAGRKDHRETCGHGAGAAPQAVPRELVASRASTPRRRSTLGRLLRKAEDVLGMPVEIEWALDEHGLQAAAGAAAARASRRTCRTRSGCSIPGSTAIRPASAGARAAPCVVNCECELSRVAPGDILVTQGRRPGAQPHPAARRRRGGRARRQHLAPRLARARARHPDGARRARCHAPHPGRRRRSRSTASPASCGGCADGQRAAHLRHPAGRQERDRRGCARSRASRSIRTTAASLPRRR